MHLGCGNRYWNGWINVDIQGDTDVQCDIRALELPSNHADRVAAIHVFEHFYYWDVANVLMEWKRVLKTGGSLILELPDMKKIMGHIMHRMKKGESPHPRFSWLAIWGDPVYKDPAMCHKWGYTSDDVVRLLQTAGFVNMRVEQPKYHYPQRDMRIVAIKP